MPGLLLSTAAIVQRYGYGARVSPYWTEHVYRSVQYVVAVGRRQERRMCSSLQGLERQRLPVQCLKVYRSQRSIPLGRLSSRTLIERCTASFVPSRKF